MQAPAQPYGLWKSPITPAILSAETRFGDVQWTPEGGLIWLESRSDANVLVYDAMDGQAPRDLTSGEQSVRGMVGYGGGEFGVGRGFVCYASKDGNIYRQNLQGGPSVALTPGFGQTAAPTVSPDGRWVLYVHSHKDVDRLAAVDTTGTAWPQIIAEGHDFYMQPCWSPDSTMIAYLSWDHPNMPWDGTTLTLAQVEEDEGVLRIRERKTIAGGEQISIFQPAFSPDGRWLAYVSDESGWAHITLYNLQSGEQRTITHGEAEYSMPAWAQGIHTYAWLADSQAIAAIRNEQGVGRLERIPVVGNEIEPFGVTGDYSGFAQLSAAPKGETIACVASASRIPPRVIVVQGIALPGQPVVQIKRRATAEAVPSEILSQSEACSWQSSDGTRIYGVLNRPAQDEKARNELPPAVVIVHGGPTSQVRMNYSAEPQFFATRGWVVLRVNYRGSTGYGRAYAQALRGKWGVYDIEDCISGARWLAEQGIADARRIIILGGSSGGFTVLEALCQAPGLFRAGVCLYGVTNHFTLATDTHKFEAHYLDSLIGPLPEARALYQERSPAFHADRIKDRMIIFQGDEDRVVPKAQSDELVTILKQRGVPHEYHLYTGEGHGWRKKETIAAYYASLEKFLRQHVIFG